MLTGFYYSNFINYFISVLIFNMVNIDRHSPYTKAVWKILKMFKTTKVP